MTQLHKKKGETLFFNIVSIIQFNYYMIYYPLPISHDVCKLEIFLHPSPVDCDLNQLAALIFSSILFN